MRNVCQQLPSSARSGTLGGVVFALKVNADINIQNKHGNTTPIKIVLDRGKLYDKKDFL